VILGKALIVVVAIVVLAWVLGGLLRPRTRRRR